ncbi:PH domain-containing protein [Luteococcus sp. Sow4_B9]|uniref:PH domain-containing protein n=1 Tax=Luteococcus sp. Sow4_B9 TaxID=3438792 RepID=UPI003F976634
MARPDPLPASGPFPSSGPDEQVIRRMHTHPVALVWPTLAFLLLAAGIGAAVALLPQQGRPWTVWASLALALVLLVWWCFLPLARWWSNTWTLTTRRLVHQQGILTRTSHALPLTRVNDISSERGVLDRMLGCGTLKLTTAAEEPVWMRDVPDVTRVHEMISQLIHEVPNPGVHRSVDQEWRD